MWVPSLPVALRSLQLGRAYDGCWLGLAVANGRV